MYALVAAPPSGSFLILDHLLIFYFLEEVVDLLYGVIIRGSQPIFDEVQHFFSWYYKKFLLVC